VSAALALYRVATAALDPLAPALLQARLRRGKEDPARLGERLGRASRPRPPGPLVWLHGASVGESLSVLPLLDRIGAARPDAALLVTSGTVTSAELLAARLPDDVVHQYVPVDAAGPVRRFLDHWRPDLAVFVESELWPRLLTEARRRGTRTALVSARLSERSARGWSRAPGFAGALLGGFDRVFAQDEASAGRLAALGARDDGRLNLKLAGQPLPADSADLRTAEAAAGGRPVLLAASTHPGEEARASAAFAPLQSRPERPLLVLVPRHPARGPELAAELGAGLRSRGDPLGAAPVYVADTLGELGLWIRLARAVFVGGGWAPGVGGHNPLEAARLDRPLASGPAVENWRSAYDGLDTAGGVRWVRSAADLTAFWAEALDAAPALRRQTEAARAFAAQGAAELERAVPRLLDLLP
jgi:3-deoxy-D-manno-octulosonic-acid transferase